MHTAVFNSHTRYNEDLSKGNKLPERLNYPKHHDKKMPYPITGVEITNESINYDLLLIDVHKHGPTAKRHAIRLAPGEFMYFGNHKDGKVVGMCYHVDFELTPEGCAWKDCAEKIAEPEKGLFILEEYEKSC